MAGNEFDLLSDSHGQSLSALLAASRSGAHATRFLRLGDHLQTESLKITQ